MPDRPDFQRVVAVFHAVEGLDAAARAALLEERCAGDAGLRAEVEALLAAAAAAGGFLEVPAAVATGLAVADDPPLRDGTRIGPYLIEREIGRGGMGMVYLGEDERLGRKVAIKVLAPAFTRDRKRRDRLRHEARAAAALAHPGIATVYALEEIDDRLYLVGEYVRGVTLREEVERGVPAAHTVIDIGLQVAHALAAAHAAGVVHRDLKPENVIRDDSGRVRILDFGVAHIDTTAHLPVQRLTEAGFLIGTPAYMSPEQLEGSDVDARSDIFALGVLLYELASGRHPFESPTPASTAARVLTAVPRSLCDINPAMPAGLEAVIRRCMEKGKADRYQSASDVARDLEALRGGAAEVRQPARTPAVTRRAARRTLSSVAEPGPIRWWVAHQLIVMAVAAVMVWPAAMVYGTMKGDWTLALLISVIASAGVNGILRAHLLFLSLLNLAELRAQLARSVPWLQRSDRLFAALLLLSAVPTARSHVVRSAVLAAVGLGWVAASVVIEPATRRAAFPGSDAS